MPKTVTITIEIGGKPLEVADALTTMRMVQQLHQLGVPYMKAMRMIIALLDTAPNK